MPSTRPRRPVARGVPRHIAVTPSTSTC